MSVLPSTYTNLVTSEYQNSPNFLAMLKLYAQWSCDRQNLLASLPGLFDLGAAVGSQLDIVGQWVGITRYLQEALTGVYFSFDTTGVGFDQGVWLGPYDPTTGLVALPDSEYRIVLQAKVAANQWDGSVGEVYSILEQIYGDVVVVHDGQDMTMTVGLITLPTEATLLQLLLNGLIAIKPAGVMINYVAPSITSAPLFGFDVEDSLISGFDVGTWPTLLGTS